MLESFLEMGARVVTTTSEARKSQLGKFEGSEGFEGFGGLQDLAGAEIYSRIFLCVMLFGLLFCSEGFFTQKNLPCLLMRGGCKTRT